MLIFISNELLNPKVQKKYKLDLKFIAYAIADATLIRNSKQTRQKDTGFMIEKEQYKVKKTNIVYGGLFYCKNFEFYGRIIDGLNYCNYSLLGFNHPLDRVYRKEIKVKIIRFDTLKDLAYLRYTEGTEVEAIAYFGNINHPKIKNKVFNKMNSFVMKDGMFANHFKELFMEVSKDAKHNFNEPKK